MSRFQGTSGDWRLTRTKRYITAGYGAPYVAEVDVRAKGWEANARLLVNAKLLVEVMEELLDEAEDVFVCMADATGIDRHNLPSPFIRARSALAKALGEQNT